MIVDHGNFRIIGAMRLCEFYPAFALAIAVCDNAPGFWLQVQGSNTQRVIGFAHLAETDEDDVNQLENKPIRVGDEYVHAFINKSGGLLLGTADALRIDLGVAMRDIKTSTSVKLEISEHLSDARLTRELRGKLAKSVARTFGDAAATTFRDSALRTRLWEMVQGLAATPASLARIRKLRTRLLACTDESGGARIDLGALDPADLTVSFEEVVARMREEFGGRLAPERLKRVDLSGLSDVADPTGQTIVDAMKRSSRQEERLAILLRAMILNPGAAERAMTRYKERAIMASIAIDRFAEMISDLRTTSENQRPQLLALEIERTVMSAYARRRGTILYYFAEHLSDFPVIERVLRYLIERSRSQAVSAVRTEILQALERRNSTFSP